MPPGTKDTDVGDGVEVKAVIDVAAGELAGRRVKVDLEAVARFRDRFE